MKVIVDTVIWSLALRRQVVNSGYRNLLRDLIADGRVLLLGAIRQEVLSGVRHKEQFEHLQRSLRAFPDVSLSIRDYELAAEYFNLCKNQGIQGANTDFLICATAVNHKCEIWTTDKDFGHFARVLPINLHRSLK